MEEQFISRLRERLQQPLPGFSAQKLMEPPFRSTLDLDASTAKEAATLLILYFEEVWKFILIRRSGHPLDKHKGQISFPGGRIENDESSEQASIREANEEINVEEDQLSMIGQLTSLYIPVSNFKVYPYVALMKMKGVKLQKQDSEVDEILHFSLGDFLNDSNVQKQSLKMTNGYMLNEVPVFQLHDNTIWGATAMMLSEFREICKEIIVS